MIKQTVLPFKLEDTKDLITAQAGLALFGEFAIGLGLVSALYKSLPAPGSGAGYRVSEHVLPLMLMLNGGGRSLEEPIFDPTGSSAPLRRDQSRNSGFSFLLPEYLLYIN